MDEEFDTSVDTSDVDASVDIDTSELNRAFCAYAMKNFGRLSSEINSKSPLFHCGHGYNP